jgi:hypothetical protein
MRENESVQKATPGAFINAANEKSFKLKGNNKAFGKQELLETKQIRCRRRRESRVGKNALAEAYKFFNLDWLFLGRSLPFIHGISRRANKERNLLSRARMFSSPTFVGPRS